MFMVLNSLRTTGKQVAGDESTTFAVDLHKESAFQNIQSYCSKACFVKSHRFIKKNMLCISLSCGVRYSL